MNEQEIFLDLLPIADRAQRQARLQAACAGDLQLQQRVELLLNAHDRAGQFLEVPAAPFATADFPRIAEGPGATIGPYKLLQQIGEGGFGVVYMADQLEPVRRKVALKIIKPGMDTREVIARFESERQALALMEHPNIARVLDAGATASGRPYFVMELVKGLTITEFADKNRMTIEHRLPLFVDVCRAVQHAHQKGVIHRDLKPTNVMVTLHDGRPVVKVIDFGVAKAVSQQLTQRTLFTAYGQMVGTPVYMSPEQAEMSGLDIDTRSDIYSLGVLLYELLTGTTPLELEKLRAAGFAEMQRLIREQEPLRPSTRFSTMVSTMGDKATPLATNRGTDVKRLGQFLRGDLDWIVMKSLEKDRNRRYETPSAFAADIERFLNNDAIVARPPSAAYRLRKLIRRNAAAVTAVGSVAAALLVGVIVSTLFGIQAKQQAARAIDAERTAQHSLAEATTTARSLATAREALRGTLYASELNLAETAWNAREYDRVLTLLDRQRPKQGEDDLRGWEWHYWRRQLTRGQLRSIAIPEFAHLGSFAPDPMGYTRPPLFTSDGERFAAIISSPGPGHTANKIAKFTVFDAATGRRLSELELKPQSGASLIQPHLSMTGDGARIVYVSTLGTQLQTSIADGQFGERTGYRFSPSESKSETILRDTRTGETIATGELHNVLTPTDVAPGELVISPDGTLIAEALRAPRAGPRTRGNFPGRSSSPPTINVLDATTRKPLVTLPSEQANIQFVRMFWSPDSKQLLRFAISDQGLVPDEDTEVRPEFQLLEARTGESVWRREENLAERNWLSAVPRAWSPDGRLIAVAIATKEEMALLELWDAATGKTLATLARPVQSQSMDPNVAFSPDSRMLAHGSLHEVHVWDLPAVFDPSAEPIDIDKPAFTFRNPNGFLRSLAFSRNGREIRAVTGTAITAWDATLREAAPSRSGIMGFPARTKFSPDAKRYADRSRTGELGIWESSTGQLVCNIPAAELGSNGPNPLSKMTFSPDGQQLAIGGVEVERPSGTERRETAPWSSWLRLYRVEDGRRIASFHVDSDVATRAPRRGTTDRNLDTPPSSPIAALNALTGGSCFRPDGSQLACVVLSRVNPNLAQLRVWDLQMQVELPATGLPWPTVRMLGYTPDGAILHVASLANESVKVVGFDAESRELRAQHEFAGILLLFDARHNRVAIRDGGDLVFYDLASGDARLRLLGFYTYHSSVSTATVAITPDGSRMAVADIANNRRESHVTLWSLNTGRKLVTLDAPNLDLIAFCSDGRRLLMRSNTWPNEQPSQIWDGTPLPGGD